MSVTVRSANADAILQQIAGALEEYGKRHPSAKIEVYRQNVRIGAHLNSR